MPLVVVSTILEAGPAYALTAGDDLLITRTGGVIGTNGEAVQIAGASDLIVEGVMAGGQIDLTGTAQRVTVGSTGSVYTTAVGVSAFRIVGDEFAPTAFTAVFDNAGQITATGGSGLQTFGFLSSLDLVNSGRLTARDSAVFFQFGNGGTVRNTGAIDGGFAGIYLEGGSVDVTNAGTIAGRTFGVQLLNGTNTLFNEGTIAGDTGVSFTVSTLVLTNAGRITGVDHGVWAQNTNGARIDNAGVISGAIGVRLGRADALDASNNAVVVNSGTILSAGIGLDVFGATPTLVNTGTMGAARMGAQGAVVDNGGTIAGGVGFTGDPGSASGNTLTNTGTITAGRLTENSTAAVFGSGIADIVLNTGLLSGGVQLGGGNDVYGGSLGRVTGAVTGEAGNDTLLGGALGETLNGGAGNDVIAGGDGNDFLQSGAGLVTDRDAMDGGAGNDVLVGSIGLDLLDGGDGTDTLFGGDNADTLLGGAARDELYGENGADVLDGGEGHDLLQGGAGADLLSGGAGDDVINGNADADTIEGGDGNDRIRPGAGADVIDGGDGLRDILDYIGSAAVNVNLTLGEGNGGDAQGDDFTGIEWLSGSGFNDILTGDGLANGLFGGAGNDVLQGAAGNDLLVGDAGNDTLVGGAGVDVMRGGLNADVFRFTLPGDSGAAGAARDRILDFSKAQLDRIDLSFIDADAALAGNQAFAFVTGAAFTAAGQVRAQVFGGDTFVFGNTDAVAATAEFAIRLSGVVALTAADLIL